MIAYDVWHRPGLAVVAGLYGLIGLILAYHAWENFRTRRIVLAILDGIGVLVISITAYVVFDMRVGP